MRIIKPKKPSEISEVSARANYPNFGIDLQYLPEAKKWQIGKDYTIILKTKMTGLNIDEGINGEYGRVSFDIRGIEIAKKEDLKEKYKNVLKGR